MSKKRVQRAAAVFSQKKLADSIKGTEMVPKHPSTNAVAVPAVDPIPERMPPPDAMLRPHASEMPVMVSVMYPGVRK